MNKIIQILIVSLITFVIPFGVFAQTNDAGAIGSVSVSKDIGRFADLTLEQEFRINKNFTTFDRSLTSLGLDYTVIKKYLKAELDYDFIYQNQVDYFEIRQRASLGLNTQIELNSFDFKFRTKGQLMWRDEMRGDYNFNPKYTWRNRIECVYNIFGSPVKPYVSGEIFCPLNGANGFYLNGYRAILGVKYRLSKRDAIDFMLRFDQDLQQANPQRIIYGGVGWSYYL